MSIDQLSRRLHLAQQREPQQPLWRESRETLERLQRALRIICVWSDFNGLDRDSVKALCRNALEPRDG